MPRAASSSSAGHRSGRLTARLDPVLAAGTRAPHAAANAGVLPLALGSGRDALVCVPSSYRADRAASLLVALHGAGGRAQAAVDLVRDQAEDHGTIVLAIDSLSVTWDVIADELGADVAFLDAALARTFADYAIDPERIAVSAFSDGASYALTLGVANGDLFGGVVAFSPGFVGKVVSRGRSSIFISHGRHDAVLPIDACSRRLVPRLTKNGHAVEYREFDGAHAVPPEILSDAFAWLGALGRGTRAR